MQLEARMLLQPGHNLGRLVGRVVVEHDVDVARFLHRPVDPAQEAQELPGAVTRHAFPDDQARLHVECREKRSGAMALVIVGRHAGGVPLARRGCAPLLERQPGLGAVERLDLGFGRSLGRIAFAASLVDAEHHCAVRRVEVEADDLGDLLLEFEGSGFDPGDQIPRERVVRDLEPLHDMRLQPVRRAIDPPDRWLSRLTHPYAPHARRRYAHRLGHRRAAPVRGIGRRLLHGLDDHLQSDCPRQGRHPRGPGLVAPQPRHAFIEIPFLPAPDRRLRHARPPHDLDCPRAVSCRQHDPGPPGKLARCVAVAQQSLKLSAVGGAKVKADVGASHPPIMPRYDSVGNPMSGAEH
jgi:hypothetical protein